MRIAAHSAMDGSTGPAPHRFGRRSRERSGALALALLLHILAFIILLLQKAVPIPIKAEQGLKTFLLPAEEKGDKKEAEAKTEAPKAARAQKEEAVREPETPPPPPPPIPTPQSDKPLPWLQISSADFAASDIGRLQNARPAPGAGQGSDSAAPAGPGSGPGGATLYPADWYREPSSTELGGYLRPGQPRQGWGTIACRTIARYHVEDCYILDEQPRGSGFGRSVLDAAWQFLVLPPRINGKSQVGTWVSIRITYTPSGGAGPS